MLESAQYFEASDVCAVSVASKATRRVDGGGARAAMLDSNVLQPSVDWPCDLLSPANVIYRFEDLASYKTFFDSDDKPLGAS